MEQENKKRRSILNLFDLTVIAVVMVLAIVVFFGNRTAPSTQDPAAVGQSPVLTPVDVSLRYTLELEGVEEQVVELFKKGEPLIDLEKKYSLGTIESIDVTPTRGFVADVEKGEFVYAVEPGLYTVHLHMTTTGVADGRNITVDGGYTIRIGKYVIGKVPGGTFTAYVVGLERV